MNIFMDKKGWVKGYRSVISFFLGLIFLFIGSYSLFFRNIQSLSFLAGLFNNDLFVYICLVIGSILLFIDSFSISHGSGKLLSILAGLIMLAIGLLPIMVIKLQLIEIPLPFVNLSVFQGILAFFGIYLAIDSFVMKSHSEIHE